MMDTVRKYEHVPDRREMMHDPMMAAIISRSKLAPLDSHTATLCDWIFLGRDQGFERVNGATITTQNYTRIEDPLWSGPNVVSFIAEDFSANTVLEARD
jgi:hypothetical protein